MSDTIITRRRPLSWHSGLALAAATTAAIVLVPASPAAAHHGWDGFDTSRLVYIAGTVSSDGSWGEPHSYFDVALDTDLPADTPALAIPEDLQDPQDSIRVESAVAYSGPQDALEIIIAPPAYTGPWGLERPLNTEERFQGVGYINRTDDSLFRPVVFWYGDAEVPVNQVLGRTLPVRGPLPGTTDPSGGQSGSPRAQDPLEETENAAGEASSATWVAWTVFGVLVIVGVGGGLLYFRRRASKS